MGQRRAAGLALAAVLLVAEASGCVARRPRTCATHSDCARVGDGNGAVCSSRGFCVQECEADVDCPCGATCVVSCGLCVRLDASGPATCFAANAGLTDDDVVGACPVASIDVADAAEDAAEVSDSGEVVDVGDGADAGGKHTDAGGDAGIGIDAGAARACPDGRLPRCVRTDAGPDTPAVTDATAVVDAPPSGTDAPEGPSDAEPTADADTVDAPPPELDAGTPDDATSIDGGA